MRNVVLNTKGEESGHIPEVCRYCDLAAWRSDFYRAAGLANPARKKGLDSFQRNGGYAVFARCDLFRYSMVNPKTKTD